MFKIDKKPTIIISAFIIIIITISIILFYINNAPYFNIDLEYSKITSFSFWWYIVAKNIFTITLFFAGLIIPIITCYAFFKIYHSGYLTNLIQRDNYNHIIKKQILYSWLKNLIIPIILLIFLIISTILFPNQNFEYSSVGSSFNLGHKFMETLSPYPFIFLYLLILSLYGIFITNISIILSRYIKKFSILLIFNFIIMMVLECIGNFIIGPIIATITKIEGINNVFSLLNVVYLDGIPNIWLTFAFLIIINIIAILIIYKIYSNKEKVLNNYE